MNTEKRPILILSDLDGTFLSSRGKTVPRNLEAMKAFRERGGRIGFATGRTFSTIEQVILPGYREMVNAPCIMCNGACVYDAREEKVLYEELLDPVPMREMVKQIQIAHPDFTTMLYAGPRYEMFQDPDPYDLPYDDWHKVVFSAPHPKGMVFSYRSELPDVVDAIRYSDRYAEDFDVPPFKHCRSAPWLLEYLSPKAGKGEMTQNIRAYYRAQGIDPLIFGIGDFENDLELLGAVDVPVCPSNAIDRVKAVAKYVVCSNDEGAIADLIDLAEGLV